MLWLPAYAENGSKAPLICALEARQGLKKCQVPSRQFPHYVTSRVRAPRAVQRQKFHYIEERLRRMRVTVVRGPIRKPGQGRKSPLTGALGLPIFLALHILICPTLGSALVAAQEVSGPLVPPGRLRIEVSTLYLYADTRFGERTEGGTLIEEEELLGFDFSDAAVGARLLPGLEALERNLETATGGPVAPLVLGSTRAVVTRDAVWLPIRIDLGVFDWLSVGGMVPFSRRRAEVALTFRGDGANAGLTPSLSDPSAVGDFLGGLAVAEAAVRALADDLCSTDPTASGCIDASSLLAEGQEFRQALLGALASQGVFPLDGTATGDALQSRVQALTDAHQALGVSFPASVPLATQLLTEDEYGRLVTDTGYGVVGAPFASWRSPWEMGDVELYANVRLWGSPPSGETGEPPSGLSYQVGAGALVRLGTGKTDSSDNFVDTGSGDGQQDLEVSLFGGLNGGRLGLWGEVRYGLAASTVVARRIAAPDRIFAPLSATQAVRWTPGNYFHLRLTRASSSPRRWPSPSMSGLSPRAQTLTNPWSPTKLCPRPWTSRSSSSRPNKACSRSESASSTPRYGVVEVAPWKPDSCFARACRVAEGSRSRRSASSSDYGSSRESGTSVVLQKFASHRECRGAGSCKARRRGIATLFRGGGTPQGRMFRCSNGRDTSVTPH